MGSVSHGVSWAMVPGAPGGGAVVEIQGDSSRIEGFWIDADNSQYGILLNCGEGCAAIGNQRRWSRNSAANGR